MMKNWQVPAMKRHPDNAWFGHPGIRNLHDGGLWHRPDGTGMSVTSRLWTLILVVSYGTGGNSGTGADPLMEITKK
jgi:hypothetical protein